MRIRIQREGHEDYPWTVYYVINVLSLYRARYRTFDDARSAAGRAADGGGFMAYPL